MHFDVDVTKQLGTTQVAASFTAAAGLTALFGPSGAGKTSVLNMIAGLLTPDKGHVRVGGTDLFDAFAQVDVPPEARRAGYVFQDARLFPHMNVRANLLYARRGVAPPDFVDRTRFLDIADLLDRWPASLSGGEARRVAIGRALLADPAFLLLDEPLSSLDARRRAEVEAVILALRDAGDLPILMVTHDDREAARLGAQIVAIGSP